MNSTLTIRDYRPQDRVAVRHICCETADAGKPVESFFRDRGFIADLVTRYYTDFTPELTQVVEKEGNVVGYLTGCFDTRRQARVTAWRILPGALVLAICRGVLWQRETWRMLAAALRNGFPSGPPVAEYPAHLHINLLTEARGNGIGARLVEEFFARVRKAGIFGVHVSVRGDNESGCRFFEGLGFVELARRPMVVPVRGQRVETAAVVYGKKL